ncbi:sulfatase [Candidatus Gottesmanbacteria bacterium]|nr:sulfatase [Candidatus Gottesmanbacteria bacterium]
MTIVIVALVFYSNQFGFVNRLIYRFKKPLCKDCNIILVSIDTLGAKHLPCYGYNRNTSPKLCAFARDNIFFANAFSNSTFTLPSHVSLFTGLLASTHGVNAPYIDGLKKDTPFLPEILKQNGYETIFVMPSTDPHLPIIKVYNRGIDILLDEKPQKSSWDDALLKLKNNNRMGKKTFLFLHTYLVHAPYTTEDQPKLFTTDTIDDIPLTRVEYENISNGLIEYIASSVSAELRTNVLSPSDTRETSDALTKITSLGSDYKKIRAIINKNPYFWGFIHSYNYLRKIDINSARHIEYIKALYDQKIKNLDDMYIDKLLSFIADESVKDDTIVVITSDHGEEFMEHGAIEHTTLYDWNTKIPLIMRIPGIGKTYNSLPVQTIDIMPSILDVVGIGRATIYLQGSGLTGNTKKTINNRLLIAEQKNKATLRWGRWKLFLNTKISPPLPTELYDTQSDPGEKNNILFSRFDVAKQILNQHNEERRGMPNAR